VTPETALALSGAELATVRGVLAAHLPPGFAASAFGSRTRGDGKVKPWSDLDLVIEGPTPLPLPALARLAEAFDESDLPWKVDLVDRAGLDAAFVAIVDADKVALG
jgi:predicted nucleotidyltransferase